MSAGAPAGGLLFVGEPGIGKTRLLEVLASRVREGGGLALYGRAFEAEQARPYGAWTDALRSAGGAGLEQSLRSLLEPVPLDGSPNEAGPVSRERLLEGVVEILSRLRGERPVAVILDDIQWLDEVSSSLLHYAPRSPACGRVLFACAARAGELSDNAASLRAVRALMRERRLTEVALGPLDQPATAELVRAVGDGLDVARVFGESEGNPLFTLEVARALSRGGAALSETLEHLIGDRLLLLEDRTREVLPWLACFGRRFSPERLADITQIPLPHVLAVLDDLERFSIVRSSGRRIPTTSPTTWSGRSLTSGSRCRVVACCTRESPGRWRGLARPTAAWPARWRATRPRVATASCVSPRACVPASTACGCSPSPTRR